MHLIFKTILIMVIFNIVYSQTLKSPIEFDNPQSEVENNIELSIPIIPVTSIIKFYQQTLSQIKGENCRMHPSCSQYSKEAIQRFGIKGVLLSADRLHRCGHDLHFYNKVIVNNNVKYFDMVPDK